MGFKKKTGYPAAPFGQDNLPDFSDEGSGDSDIGDWGGGSWEGPGGGSNPGESRWNPPGGGNNSGKPPWKPSGGKPSLPMGDWLRQAGDLFTRFAWYDFIFAPLTLLFLVMILLNLDTVLLWFAQMTVRLLDVSIVLLIVVVILLLIMAFIRGGRNRRNRRRGWF